MVQVKIDEEQCIGCGSCVAMCGEVFEMVGEKAKVREKSIVDDSTKDAAESCPVKAITLV